MTLSDTLAALSEAVRETEYKYFGDYEFSDDQRKAVDTLVDAANAILSGQLVPVPSVERVSKAVHEALCRVDVIRYLDLPPQTAENVAMVVIAAMKEGRE